MIKIEDIIITKFILSNKNDINILQNALNIFYDLSGLTDYGSKAEKDFKNLISLLNDIFIENDFSKSGYIITDEEGRAILE